MKENKDCIAYQRDLESGILDNYRGKVVAYSDGNLVRNGVCILYTESEREMISELQSYSGSFMVQKVGAPKETVSMGGPRVRSSRRSRK